MNVKLLTEHHWNFWGLQYAICKRSDIGARVLLNLSNELAKDIKCKAFRNEFNKFNNTGARMLDCVCHMELKLLLNHV